MTTCMRWTHNIASIIVILMYVVSESTDPDTMIFIIVNVYLLVCICLIIITVQDTVQEEDLSSEEEDLSK